MNIIFRVDGSFEIGAGHIFRCLTLADELQSRGATCEFISNKSPGNQIEIIKKKGFKVYELDFDPNIPINASGYSEWLGRSIEEDALACSKILKKNFYDWMIVDHYALDEVWQSKLRGFVKKIMVIDDLANRSHDCDILLDQNLGRKDIDYLGKLPINTKCLIGPKYSLLRPEFSNWRNKNIKEKNSNLNKEILITMGGSDEHNVTYKILNIINSIQLPQNTTVTAIVSKDSPWIKEIKDLRELMVYKLDIISNITNIAEYMFKADICIGASGTTSWERCCLGLPSIVSILADNQIEIANALNDKGAAINIGLPSDNLYEINLVKALNQLLNSSKIRNKMANISSNLVDGDGVIRVTNHLLM